MRSFLENVQSNFASFRTAIPSTVAYKIKGRYEKSKQNKIRAKGQFGYCTLGLRAAKEPPGRFTAFS